MEQICPQNRCTACAACMNACPKDAISMCETGAGGYLYPVIDASRCIDCNLCEKVCPANHPPLFHEPLAAYAARSKDESDYMSSASGGAASVLAAAILAEGGTVYGCEMENWKTFVHRRYESRADMERMKGSKYVQSTMGYIMRDVKRDLQSGRKVLFTGTPCQVAGLRGYLRKDYENLYCVDLVCHGVPSQKLLRDNVEAMCTRYGVTPRNDMRLTFRKKSQTADGNLRYGVFLTEHAIPGAAQEFPKNDYITAFMSGIIFRENCFSCPYAQQSRVSDVTVADFWGLSHECRVPRPAGISLLLPTTKKGKALIESCKETFLMEERPVREAVRGNGQLCRPSVCPANRSSFFNDYAGRGQAAYNSHLVAYRRLVKRQALKRAVRGQLRKLPFLYTIYKQIKKK